MFQKLLGMSSKKDNSCEWREKKQDKYHDKKKRESFLLHMIKKRAFNTLKTETVIAKKEKEMKKKVQEQERQKNKNDDLYYFLCKRFIDMGSYLPYSIERWVYEN